MPKILFKVDHNKVLFVCHPKMQQQYNSFTTDQKKFAWRVTEDDNIDAYLKDGFTLESPDTDFRLFKETTPPENSAPTVLDFLWELSHYFNWSSPKNNATLYDMPTTVKVDGKDTTVMIKARKVTEVVDGVKIEKLVSADNSKVFEPMSKSDLRRMCDSEQVFMNGEPVSADELFDFSLGSIVFFPKNEKLRNTVW
jgi:hypothetical protein